MGTSSTVSSVITNACYLLSENQAVWKRFRYEITALRDTRLNVETLRDMPYARKILDEIEQGLELGA
jgi:cytochrome P450